MEKKYISIDITLPAKQIQCRNFPLENIPVAFAVGASSPMSDKKPVTILNVEENTIEDNVQNGTKKQRIFSQQLPEQKTGKHR